MSFDSRDQDTGNSITLTRSEYQLARFKGKIFSLFMFNALLVFLTIVGIYHSFTGGKQKTTDEYLRGGQTIAIWPAILSLSVSFMSSVSMLGLPAEIYTFGGQFWLGTLGWTLGHFLSVLVYVPVLYPLQTTTANEVIVIEAVHLIPN